MDFAVLDELREAAEDIHFSTEDEIRRSSRQSAGERKATQRREFATLIRSIKSLVHENG